MSRLRPPLSAKLRRGIGPAMLCAGLLFTAPLTAQTLTNSFGGLSQSSGDPIDIESDMLVVQDKQKLATFKGNVKAVQGSTTLRAAELQVHYVGGDSLTPGAKKDSKVAATPASQDAARAAGGETDNAKITKIEARGNVVITSEDDQTTTSDWAIYDLPAQQVTVGGNVVLTQGKNVLKGDRLVIDLTTGESRFDNTGGDAAGSRIRALFMPKQDGKGAKDGKNVKPGNAKPDAAKAQDGGNGKPDAAAKRAETPADGGPDDVPWPITPGTQP